jgi:o-succinylbenzoate synthase
MNTYKAKYEKRTFFFKQPSGTSRGILTEKHAWFLFIWNTEKPEIVGVGECSIIPGLSPDFIDFEQYENKVKAVVDDITHYVLHKEELVNFPSILFGLECAELDCENGGIGLFFDTPFYHGKSEIPINGLIWMGDESFMRSQVEEKLEAGYSCIKMKVGAIDFEAEWNILNEIRKRYSPDQLILRVDANGAFDAKNADYYLNRLAELHLHSIEQPIAAGNWSEMKTLCMNTPLSIALDEELIGITTRSQKELLLQTIQPQFIILKPSLHGGFQGCREWIQVAESLSIPWWITSALESNVGLNAITQFTATFDNLLHQGLGTGALYVENTPSSLRIEDGKLRNDFHFI